MAPARCSRAPAPPRARRGRPGACPALLALSLAACAGREREEPFTAPAPVVVTARGEPIEPDLVPAFETLRNATDAGDDALARRVLDGLLARDPQGSALDTAESFGRILHGRELVDALTLELESQPTGQRGVFRLTLVMRQRWGTELELRLPPVSLERLIVAVDARGVETRTYDTRLSAVLEGLVVPPTGERRVGLCVYDVYLGRALALRERWRVATREGQIREGTELFPAADVAVASLERTYVASYFPRAAVEPAEFLSYLQRDTIALPPLLERAVRIAPERREEALDGLLPVARLLAHTRPQRFEEAAPALRWLARTGAPGVDPQAWVDYLERRAARPPSRENLLLPGGDDEEPDGAR